MGVILMRPLTSGVFQRLMAWAWATGAVASDIDSDSRVGVGVGRLLLETVLSDPYMNVALVEGGGTRLREPRFVELNNEISDDVALRIDGHGACLSEACLSGAARSVCEIARDLRGFVYGGWDDSTLDVKTERQSASSPGDLPFYNRQQVSQIFYWYANC